MLHAGILLKQFHSGTQLLLHHQCSATVPQIATCLILCSTVATLSFCISIDNAAIKIHTTSQRWESVCIRKSSNDNYCTRAVDVAGLRSPWILRTWWNKSSTSSALSEWAREKFPGLLIQIETCNYIHQSIGSATSSFSDASFFLLNVAINCLIYFFSCTLYYVLLQNGSMTNIHCFC